VTFPCCGELFCQYLVDHTGCVSESGDFATLFFFWFGKTAAYAAITILLPTLKRFG
jgi:hypothetical protein